ncbi:MAG: HD domain-containing protein [Spirochaetaceae bacterium]|jgi:HD superfamily phosphohydrolase|nr:HD domain-containing protein [Spirochaetaceae bacterium]
MTNTINSALHYGYTEPIRDALWGHIYLTPEQEALTRTPAFMRLHRIAQLGPAGFCYPGATHTRAAHSIGVYHLTKRLLVNLVERGAETWLTPSGVQSMLCAALLHDLGHFPYAHSLKELLLTEHEALGAKIIISEPVRSLIGKTGADPELTAAILDTKLPAYQNRELLFYRSLLSGSLDPDKLDYLNRDARYCGVPYGAQDVDYIISIMYPHPERGIEIDSRGIPSVESVLFSKYLMYRSVYWHHSVRSATSMIKKALCAGLQDKLICSEDLYNLDDNGLFSLLSMRNHPSFTLGEAVRQGHFYALAWEMPFEECPHNKIENDVYERSLYETELAHELSKKTGQTIDPKQIIVDVPERASFETNLFVRDENKVFSESSSFFKSGMVCAFVKTLRVLRVFVDRDLKTRLPAAVFGK